MNSKLKGWFMVIGYRLSVFAGTKHQTPNTKHRILIPILIYGLLTIGHGLIYGQDDHLTVKSTKADTLIFSGDKTAYPETPLEGEVFYNSSLKLPQYYDGTTWRSFSGSGPAGSKMVATEIVAASNTPDGASRADAGFVCDGTDDQQEINKAINSLPATGGAVYLLEGTYNISTALLEGETLVGIVPHNNTAIIGAGKGTVLKIVSDASNVIVINASSVSRILISQLMIDGNSGTGSNNAGIDFTTVTHSKIDKVWVENIATYGIGLNSSSHNTISNNNLQSNGSSNSGIYLSGVGASNNTISGNNLQGNGRGISLWTPSSNNIISDNNIQNNSAYGINLSSCSDNTISGNNIQGNGRGISLSDTSNNNLISGNNVQGNATWGISFGGGGASNNIISHNNIQNNTWQGICFYGTSNSSIIANVIYENGSGAYDGISLGGTASNNNLISSNRLYDSAGTGFGINIAATCDNNYLVGNFIDGTTGTSSTGYYNPLATPPYDHRIQDLGAGTQYTDKAKITLEKKQIDIGSLVVFYNLDVATYPRGYVALNPAGSGVVVCVLANGKSAGDMLILENISSTKQVNIAEAANVNLGVAVRNLGQYDVLRLLWNGAKWLETAYVDNAP